MLKLWLVYDADRLVRNRWMAQHYVDTGKAMGLEIRVVDPADLPVEAVDATIIRCDAPRLRAQLASPAFNPDAVAAVGNDKWVAYQHFHAAGVPMLHTATDLLPGPFVAKPRRGHGGEGVRIAGASSQISKDEIAQEIGDTPGHDLRVYLLGGEVMAGMLRISQTDFRSNFSLGGAAYVHEVGSAEREIVARVVTAMPELRDSFVGVDLMPHAGGWVLNEIEDVVGTRMLYAHTNIDPVPLHLELVRARIR